jgi:hypothetical protein
MSGRKDAGRGRFQEESSQLRSTDDKKGGRSEMNREKELDAWEGAEMVAKRKMEDG